MALSETFENKTIYRPQIQVFEQCVFKKCTFEDISCCEFLKCEFHDCNFSNCKTNGTAFQETTFVNCKMLGVNFSQCNTFLLSFRFENCQLDYSDFSKIEIPRTSFCNSSLKDVLFEQTKLSASTFAGSNLQNATFHRCDLSHCDFNTAQNFTIIPKDNLMRQAKFSIYGLEGLLTEFGLKICQ